MRNFAMCRAGLTLALVGGLIVGCGPLDGAAAQDGAPAQAAKAKPPKGKKVPAAEAADPAQAAAAKDPAVATRNYETGLAAYRGGKYDVAVQSMNAAVQGGGLPGSLLAKALYYRGASYYQQAKHGQAISDLTSALWLKGGLDDAERAEASRLRSAAYKDAGLSEQGQVAAQSGGPAGQGSAQIAASSITTGSVSPAAGPSLGALPSEQTAASSGGLGDLLGNLFGGGSKPAPAPAVAAAPPAAPLPAPIPAPAPAVSAAAAAEVLPWSNKDEAAAAPASPAPSKPPKAAKAAPAAAPKPTPAAAAAGPGGAFTIQVAAVKSRDEASEVAAKVKAAGGILASAPTSVDEATFGSMGTFYRVKLGPYANAAAAKAPCEALKAAGMDCLVTK